MGTGFCLSIHQPTDIWIVSTFCPLLSAAVDISTRAGVEDPLEEEMAAHSGILVWRTPGTEKEAWWATVHEVTKCWIGLSKYTNTAERASDALFSFLE